MKNQIEISTTINRPVKKVWTYFTEPKHIKNWYFASSEWHAPLAENDLRVGGKFKTRMEAVDASTGFDFEGVYTIVKEYEFIEYILEDGRKVEISFKDNSDNVVIREIFDIDNVNSAEAQKGGWQAILNNFKAYVESK